MTADTDIARPEDLRAGPGTWLLWGHGVAGGSDQDRDEHRPSWVNLDRVIRVHEAGMRREAAALPREPFERVTERLHQRYGWH